MATLDPLAATVDFARVGRAAAHFPEEHLAQFGARQLPQIGRARAQERLRGNTA